MLNLDSTSNNAREREQKKQLYLELLKRIERMQRGHGNQQAKKIVDLYFCAEKEEEKVVEGLRRK